MAHESHGDIDIARLFPALLGLGAGVLALGVILLITGSSVAIGLALIVVYGVAVAGLMYSEIRERDTRPGETVRLPGVGFPLAVFLGSEVFIFGAAFIAYFVLRAQSAVWPPPGIPHLETFIPSIQTAALILSSVIIEWGISSIRRGNENKLKVASVATILLGTLFLSLQLYEYPHLGFGPSDGVFGFTFFTLTGFHGAHVFGGILALLLVSVKALLGHFSKDDYGPLEATATYWHFVHIVWIVLFATLWRM